MESGHRALTKVLTTSQGGSVVVVGGGTIACSHYSIWLLLTQGVYVYFYLGLLQPQLCLHFSFGIVKGVLIVRA